MDENSTDLAIDDGQDALDVSEDDTLAAEIQVTNQSIDTGKVTKRYNVGVEYSAVFYDESGDPLKNTIVYCGVDAVAYGVNATTDSSGKALFLFPADKGTHTLYLINPVTYDVSTDSIKVFDVITGGKNIKTYFNAGKTYTVRIYGDDAKPVKAGEKVTFYINSKKKTIKTDSNGYAKLKIDFQPGSYIITVKYRDFLAANKITVKPVLIPLTQFGSKALGKTFSYKVKLLNSKGKVFKNKKITIKFNKKTYKAKTNKKGIAVFKLKTPLKAGKYNIVSSYGKAKATAQLIRYAIR